MYNLCFVLGPGHCVLESTPWIIGKSNSLCKSVRLRPPHRTALPQRLRCLSTAVPMTKSADALSSSQPKGTTLLEDLSPGDKFVGQVVRIGGANSLWLDVGVVRRASRGKFCSVDARLRFSITVSKNEDGSISCKPLLPREKVGSKLSVLVKKVNVGSGRLEVERVNKIASMRSPLTNRKRRRKPQIVDGGIRLESLEVSQKLDGKVSRLGQYGALIDCGIVREGRRGSLVVVTGLMKREHFPEKCASDVDMVFRDDVERKLLVGDDVTVYVRAAHSGNGTLLLSGVPVDEVVVAEERKARRKLERNRHRKKGPASLTVGGEILGTVRRQVSYGAFIDVGISTDALLHYTNMGKRRWSDWRLKLAVGAQVVVKVLSNTNDRVGLELVDLFDDIRAKVEQEYGMPVFETSSPELLTPEQRYQKELNDAVRLKTFAIMDGKAVRPGQRFGSMANAAVSGQAKSTIDQSVLDFQLNGEEDSDVGDEDPDMEELDTDSEEDIDDFDETFNDDYFASKYNI